MIFGTIHVVFVGNEHLTEIVCLTRLAQEFTFNKCNSGIIPTRSTTVLILDGGDSVFQDSGKLE